MSKPVLKDLTQRQKDQLEAAKAGFCGLVEETNVDPEADQLDTPELADIVVAHWRRLPPAKRPSLETLATMLGAAIGDFLIYHLRLEWKEVTDEYGTSLVLFNGENAGEMHDVYLAVFDSMLKRLEEEAEGDFVAEYVEGLWEAVGHLQRQK